LEQKRTYNPSGFTVIELVIVIAVISILISMVFAVKGFQIEARKIAAQSDLRVLRVALESYYKNYGSKYPPVRANWEDTLSSTRPAIIDSTLNDPFAVPVSQFGYALSPNSSYYVIYSVGPRSNGSASIVDTGKVTVSNEVIWDSNGTL
jgi:prepilin-type N-terminal cleavage/methylation domain-containing protein